MHTETLIILTVSLVFLIICDTGNVKNFVKKKVFKIKSPVRHNVIATILVEGLKFLPEENMKKVLLFTTKPADGCDGINILHPKARIYYDEHEDKVDQNMEFILMVNSLKCNLVKKLANARSAGYTMLLIHDTLSDNLPESNIWGSELEAYARSHGTKMINVYFIGQKHGRLLADIFAYPNGLFGFSISSSDDDKFFLAKDYLSEIAAAGTLHETQIKKKTSKPKEGGVPLRWYYSSAEIEYLLTTYMWVSPLLAVILGAWLFFFQCVFLIALYCLFGVGGILLIFTVPSLLFLGPLRCFQYFCRLFGISIVGLIQRQRRDQLQGAEQLEQNSLNRTVSRSVSISRDSSESGSGVSSDSGSEYEVYIPPTSPAPISLEPVQIDSIILRLLEIVLAAETNRRGGIPSLTAAQVELLPRRRFSTTDETLRAECSICLEHFVDGIDVMGMIGCSHIFHHSCISSWLSRIGNCPNCRAPALGNN